MHVFIVDMYIILYGIVFAGICIVLRILAVLVVPKYDMIPFYYW